MKLPDVLDLINPAVRGQKPYHLDRRDVPVKLNQNENPFDWPLPIKEEIGRFCSERPWNRYPPFIPEELKVMLGDYIGVAPDSIIAGNGSNEMLLVLMLALAKKGEKIILCQPTFTVYHLLAEGIGAGSETVYLDGTLQFDLNAILAASRRLPQSPLIICSPNNPTGSELNETAVRTILAEHRGFFILDQAYVEFGGFNAAALIAEYPNFIVTRTFSKAFAGAGLRVGYMAGQPAVISQITKIKLPYNINFFSEFVARTALRHRSELATGIGLIMRERTVLSEFLSTLPVTVFPSCANFICIRTTRKQELFDALLADGILIRDVSTYPMLENCLRISIGTPEENLLLQKSMQRFFTGT
jgi:histidinol-phosphate aminotransferase